VLQLEVPETATVTIDGQVWELRSTTWWVQQAHCMFTDLMPNVKYSLTVQATNAIGGISCCNTFTNHPQSASQVTRSSFLWNTATQASVCKSHLKSLKVPERSHF
jgi:hypothetical protein